MSKLHDLKTERRPFEQGYNPDPKKLFKLRAKPISLESLVEHGGRIKDYLEEIEDSLILEAIIKAKGNQTHAAELVGLNRTTVVMKLYRLRDYGIDLEAYRPIENKEKTIDS